MAEADPCWGRLTCGRKLSKLPAVVALKGKKFIIGRGGDCHLQLGVKMVSSQHCYLEKDDEGKVWLYDTSSNGTFLNRTVKLTPGQGHQLQDGDKVYLVYYKKRPDLDICYALHLNCDEKDSGESSDRIGVIQNEEATSTDDMPKAKRPRLSPPAYDSNTEEDIAEEGKDKEVSDENTDKNNSKDDESKSEMTEDSSKNKPEKNEGSSKKETKEKNEIEEVLQCSLCMDILYDPVSLVPCMHCYCSTCYCKWMQVVRNCPQCRAKVDSVARNHIVKNLIDAYLVQHPEKQRSKADIEKLDELKTKVAHMLSVKASSTSSRSGYYDEADDYFRVRYFGSDDDGISSSDDDFDPFYKDRFELEMEAWPCPIPLDFRAPVCRQCPRDPFEVRSSQLNHNNQNSVLDLSVVTAERVGKITEKKAEESAGNSAKDASGSNFLGNFTKETSCNSSDNNKEATRHTEGHSQARVNEILLYRCPSTQIHIRCSCCYEAMPDRSLDRMTQPSIPPQSCTLCGKHFCNLYWACRKADCNGCLAEFGEINFGEKCLPLLIMKNKIESRILMDYLERQELTWKDLLRECVARLDSNQYTSPFSITSKTVLCYSCGLKAFSNLAYCYRRDILQEDLPGTEIRQDCYWGKNCRTQSHKLSHAMKYNHICEQTRK